MDFDQYVAARHGRLIEHAVFLGCAEGEAASYVDQVLVEQRKAIGKADDPDPLVHDALERAITGPRRRRGRAVLFVALGVLALVVAGVATVAYRPPPEPMPSLFGLDGSEAQQLLEDQGYDVTLQPAGACEPAGLVLGSDPPAGRPVERGATVTVRTAVPSGLRCDQLYAIRSDAWQFVRFALGGPPPEFARTVTIVVDSWDPWHLDHVAAVDSARWGDLMRMIATTARASASTENGMPKLTTRTGILPTGPCGVPQPNGTQGRAVLRIEIDPRSENDRKGCPLTIDLYRSSGRVIDGVVVYTAKDAGRGLAPGRPPGVRRLGVVGYHDRPQPRPGEEDHADHEHREAGPEVGVDAARLVQLLVAEQAHQHQDHAVGREQPADDVADVKGAGGVPLLGLTRLVVHLALLRRSGSG